VPTAREGTRARGLHGRDTFCRRSITIRAEKNYSSGFSEGIDGQKPRQAGTDLLLQLVNFCNS
jgi:hypothetical protein